MKAFETKIETRIHRPQKTQKPLKANFRAMFLKKVLPTAPAARLSAVYVQDGDWVVAWFEEMPEVMTQGATIDEARVNLRDALREMLAAQRELSRADLDRYNVVHRESLKVGG